MLVRGKIRVVLSLPTSGHMVLRRPLEVKRLLVLQRVFQNINKAISLCCLCHIVRATQHLEKYLKQGYGKERRFALEMLCNKNILAKNKWCGTPITVQSGDHIVPLRGPCHSNFNTQQSKSSCLDLIKELYVSAISCQLLNQHAI